MIWAKKLKKRMVKFMRLVHYEILNENTKKIINVGCNSTTAQNKLEEMKKANPENNYRIIYKWLSI